MAMWQPGDPKPARGEAKLEWRRRRADIIAAENAEKHKARRRDFHRCRWPGCDCRKLRLSLESAHFRPKGMGGDHGLRSTRENLITFDELTHKGAKSLHSTHKKVEPLTDAVCDGPCEFFERDYVEGEWTAWRLVGRERAVGVLEPLTGAGQ